MWRNNYAEFFRNLAHGRIHRALPRFEFAASTDELACAQPREFFAEQNFGAGTEERPAASHQIDHTHVVHKSHRTPSTPVFWGLPPSH